MKKYYLIYNASTDLCEPISENDAINFLRKKRERDYSKNMKKELGYDLVDNDLLVAVRLEDIEQLEKIINAESEKNDTKNKMH